MTARAGSAQTSLPVAAASVGGWRSTRLFVSSSQLRAILLASVLTPIVLVPVYASDSWWIGVGLALTVFVSLHLLFAARVVPGILGLAACVACLQGILAPWIAYHLPGRIRGLGMSLPPADYFSFAVPAAVAYVAGMYVPLRRIGRRVVVRNELQAAASPRMVRTLMIMVVVGVATRLVIAPIAPGSLRYVARLVSNLAYVGGFGLMLARTPRWWMWLGAPFLIEAVFCAIDGQFSDLLMWSCCLSLVAAYHFRLRSRTLVAVFGVALVAVIALNGIKSDFRQTVRSEGLQSDERVALAARSWYTLFSSPGLVFSAQNLAFNVSRLNQGAITSRVLLWTPAAEPFARGETIWAAIRAALLPRILDPNKYVAGGFDNYPRFTGLQLNPGTSINISVPGEMYANFGRGGAYIGVFMYGVFLGLVFRTITRLARRSILWWAWAPFLLFSSIPAESGVGETLNQVSKSLVVMWAVMTTVPAWRVLRRSSRPIGGGDVSRARPGMDLLVGGRI